MGWVSYGRQAENFETNAYGHPVYFLRSLPCCALPILTAHNVPLSAIFFVTQLFKMAPARGKFGKFIRKREPQKGEKLAAFWEKN